MPIGEVSPWSDLNLLLRLLVAAVLTGLLGWERESRGKAAGLRTHMLVGVSASLFVVVGELMVARYHDEGALMRLDMIGILGAVVSGISFLGAGTIFVSKGNVQGLTTAASLLATAAVGVSTGLERYVLAAGATLLLLIILRALTWFERWYGPEEK